MTDYKAAFANAGTFAIAAASFIAGTFVLPNEFGNLERLLMIVAAVGVYAIGHITGQRFAGRSFSVDKKDLEHELEKANDNLARLADAEERAQTLQNLLGAERTLSSSYKEKLARSEERLRHYEDKEAEEEARERAREDRRCVAFREGMPFKGKKLLASLMYGGPRDVPGADSEAMWEYFGDEAYSHVIVEEVGDDVVRVSLCDGSREFFERHPELLEDARKALPQES